MASAKSKDKKAAASQASDRMISVLVRAEAASGKGSKDRGGNDRGRNVYLSDYIHAEVSTEQLHSGISGFLDKMKEAVGDVSSSFNGYHLDTIELAAEVNAKGSLILLGLGEVGGKAGIKFTFTREKP